MKTIIAIAIVAAVMFFVLDNAQSSNTELRTAIVTSEMERLAPYCNNVNPAGQPTGTTFHFYCNGGTVSIDWKCCSDLWSYYGGQPPANPNCNVIFTACQPE